MLISLIVSTVLSTVMILLLIKNAVPLRMVSVPNERSAHEIVTPCGAGIAFIAAAFVGVVSNDWSVYLSDYLLTVVAILMVYLLGIYDDYKHSSSNIKFFIIIFASILVLMNGLEIKSMGTYFGEKVELGFFSILLSIVAIVGFTNALNLVDGLDGLAGSLSLIIFSGLSYIGYVNNDNFIFNISIILLPALLVFLSFNWNPAKVFMGDSGSLTLGFIIAVLCIKALAYIDPVSILFIAALPVLDTVTVMIRRWLNGQSMFRADKNHLHHILLNRFKGNVKKTVLIMVVIQLMFTLFGLFVAPKFGQEITLTVFFGCFLITYWGIRFVERKMLVLS